MQASRRIGLITQHFVAGETSTAADAPTAETATAAKHWDERWSSDSGREGWTEAAPEIVQLIEHEWAGKITRALDLGCGVGRHALALAVAGIESVGVDQGATGLEYAADLAEKAGLKNVSFEEASMLGLPHADNSFELVLSFNVIYHGDAAVVDKALGEISRVLTSGGEFWATMLSTRSSSCGVGVEISPGCWIDSNAAEGDDKAHPHFFCSAATLASMLDKHSLELQSLEDVDHGGGKYHWHLRATKA